jgi:hypothetical protein
MSNFELLAKLDPTIAACASHTTRTTIIEYCSEERYNDIVSLLLHYNVCPCSISYVKDGDLVVTIRCDV